MKYQQKIFQKYVISHVYKKLFKQITKNFKQMFLSVLIYENNIIYYK